MPTAAPSACRHPGCPGLALRGHSGYCEAHKKERPSAVRISAARRGYDARWRRVRRMALARHPFCADPFERHGMVLVGATDVDHIIPKKAGGTDRLENLQSLCHACHSIKTRRGE